MTRRTLVASNLADYFNKEGVEYVKDLKMSTYANMEDLPYRPVVIKRIYGSWSRAMLVVQSQLNKKDFVQVEETEDAFAAFADLR